MVDGMCGLIGLHVPHLVVLEARRDLDFAPTPNQRLEVVAVMVKMSCTKAALSSHVIKMILFGLLGQVGPSVPQLALRDIRSD